MRDIAIVGMGCRFPGARDLNEYWRLLLSAEPQFRSVPSERWDHRPHLDASRRPAPGTSYTDQIAFLDDVDQFAAAAFRISPRRAKAMDPQHRLLLEVTREAVQDAGWENHFGDREDTGVFFAMSNSEYGEANNDIRDLQPYAVPGNLLNMAATTVSQWLDLGGPSFTVDSACSSGLVATQEAVNHLRAGTCKRAIVGGAYLNLIPHSLVGFSKVGALSRDGVCRPFDTRADGFVLGEGVGVLVLRPLDEALADGDRVYAVLRGVGSANDGTTDGPMTPRAEGQQRAMAAAYRDCGFEARTVEWIEAHGTATNVGDRVELESLGATWDVQPGDAPTRLTSVKSLVGHSLTASGTAGLIKVALGLHHGVVPPHPAATVDPAGPLATGRFELPTEPVPWRNADAPRRAALNSFGFGGTNVHLVLEKSPEVPALPAPARPELIVLSAANPQLLVEHVRRTITELDEITDAGGVAALARTLAARTVLASRLAVVAADVDELRTRLTTAADQLEQGREGALGDGVFAAAAPLDLATHPIAFVFPGQGSQRPHMLRDLAARYPDFAAELDRLDAAAQDATGFSPIAAVHADDADTADGRAFVRRTEHCQPTLGVFGLATAALLERCGVVPTLTVGHSVGEFSAGAHAGVLPAAAAVRMLAVRGAAMGATPAGELGGMMLVQGSPTVLATITDGIADVWPACFNQPRQITFSGTHAGLTELEARCAAQGATSLRLEVSHPFHSPLLDGVRDAVRAGLDDAHLVTPERTFVSSVAPQVVTDPEQVRELWREHASAPVRFTEAAAAAYEAGARIFVQVTGGRSLLGAVRRSIPTTDGCHFVAVTADTPDEGRSLLAALGQLITLGVPARVPDDGNDAPLITVPAAPLRRRSYWFDPPSAPLVAALPTPDPNPVPTAEVAPAVPTPDPLPEDSTMSDLVSLMREQLALLGAAGATAAVSTAPAAPVAVPAPAPAPAATPAPPAIARTQIRDGVYAELTRISGFGADELDDGKLVVQELGFDSLMFTEFLTGMKRRLPALGAWPTSAPKRPTVGELVTALSDMAGAPAAAPAPAPAPTPAPVAPAPVETPPVELAPVPTTREDGIANWSGIDEHAAELAALGRNPYFLVHEGNARDTTRIDGRELISYSSYNYLGLSGHPAVNACVQDAVERYGTSVSASRFLSGDRPVHHELEAELAALLGTEDAIVLVSGHATNVTVIGHLVGPEDLIVYDELAHDSILQGCALSGATRRPFAHNDPEALDSVLTRLRPRYRRVLIVVEGVYSMDGDIAALPEIVRIKDKHGAVLMVDEAHSIGTVGPHGGGIGDHFGIDRSSVELWSGTMSKSLASCGGYVGGSRRIVEYLKYCTPGFVYSVGMTPANTAAALGALRTMRAEPERLERLRRNAELFLTSARAAGLDTGTSEASPVVPCVVGDSAHCLELAHALFDLGISVNPIMYPGVPEEQARLRFFITSEHTPQQLVDTVDITARELARIRANAPAADLAAG